MRPTPLVQTVSGRTDCIRNDTTRPGYHRRSDWLSDGRWFDDLSIPTTDLWIPTNDLGIPANEFSEPIAPVRRRNYDDLEDKNDDLQGKADDLEGTMISKVRNETLFLSNYSGSEAKDPVYGG